MNDFLYKHIEVENLDDITKELTDWHDKNVGDKTQFKIISTKEILRSLPKLNQWFISNNLKPTDTVYLNINPLTNQAIHLDRHDKRSNNLALNFPIKNCGHTFTRFYKDTGKYTTWINPETNASYLLLDEENPELLGEYYLTKPTLLNILVPHQVFNPTLHPRVCLSFRFKDDPWHLVNKDIN
jgi:hypothetical protein